MKHFLIKYRHTTGTTEDWHREIASFIAALDGDPALKGKIGYRCMKGRDGADYYHLATVFDDTARVALQGAPSSSTIPRLPGPPPAVRSMSCRWT
jgi:hypothetical protein